ncbi:unnamed protein product [Linum trigynum]|uniref:Uncharacterized protein n=1 Tax=Linum trigynum TaxID=586398 RepID=A0AAV2DBC1_9ROSI
MKAGTRANRPPPPPRGRILHQSPGDAGSSSDSPGFLQNQLWISGGVSPATGSYNPAYPATPSIQVTEETIGHVLRGPPGFTLHPFLARFSSRGLLWSTSLNGYKPHICVKICRCMEPFRCTLLTRIFRLLHPQVREISTDPL